MLDNVNTTALVSCQGHEEDNLPIMVDVNNVSMIFNMASEQLNSLKEYFIAIVRRELMFKEFRALDNVSFQVKKGDVFGILGTNGSGKSTILKIIAGVLDPTEGACNINGKIAPLIELGAGFDLDLTARENIYLNGSLLGYSRKFIHQHFDEIVEFAEIEEFLDMPMKNYSSGMVARIAFAIATVIVPEILIVDEVLSVGDFMFQQKCERRITQLIKDYGVTVLIVSHNNDQIERLCNRAIWIEKGHVRMLGSAEEVCRTYRVLGGHTGSAESEQQILKILNETIEVSPELIDSIRGESRYGIATKLVNECDFPLKAPVIIAPGEIASPCIAVAGLSSILNAPVLLARSDGLTDITAQELKRLKPNYILITGNENILSSQVTTDIEEVCGDGTPITRIPGSTSAEIANAIYTAGLDAQNSWGRTAFITYDDCIGDLISFSPYLFQKMAPVFFVAEHGVVSSETANYLKSGAFDHLLVLGGNMHIPNAFLASCEAVGIQTERVCGSDPYDANELINDRMASSSSGRGSIAIERLIVTSVWNPYDALAAAAYAAKTHSAFLLEDPQNLDSVAHAISYIQKKGGAVKHLTFLGDMMRFNELDKEILGKAVATAIKTSSDKI